MAMMVRAVWEGNDALVEELVSKGAKVSGGMEGRLTLMHYAAACGSGDVIVTLVRLGSTEINTSDGLSRTPLKMALDYDNDNAIRTLLALGAQPHFWMSKEYHPTEDEAHEIRWRAYFRESFVQKLLREIKIGEHL